MPIFAEQISDYGKLWDEVKEGNHGSKHERERALYHYSEILSINQGLRQLINIHDAAILYNDQCLEPPLEDEQFNKILYQVECRVGYLDLNKLVPCFCDEHKNTPVTITYDRQAHEKVINEFFDSDISKGIELLRYIESLLENKKNSVYDMRKSLMMFNDRETRLDYHKLNQIWDIAVERAPDDVQKKIIIDLISNGENKCSIPGCNCKAEYIYDKDGKFIM